MGYNAEEMPMRAQLIGLLHAVQYLKFPVIIANCITIVFEMLLGGSWRKNALYKLKGVSFLSRGSSKKKIENTRQLLRVCVQEALFVLE